MGINFFDQALVTTLGLEGGYTENDVSPTNHGVRQDMFDAYNDKKKQDRVNVKDMTYNQMRTFYKDDYWDVNKLDDFPIGIATQVFDYGVNAGAGTAAKKLQSIVGTKEDGIVGKKTKKAVKEYIEKHGEKKLIEEYLNLREKHYNDIVTNNPEKMQYHKGWMNRINFLRNL
jgi:lysozyme family protein